MMKSDCKKRVMCAVFDLRLSQFGLINEIHVPFYAKMTFLGDVINTVGKFHEILMVNRTPRI